MCIFNYYSIPEEPLHYSPGDELGVAGVIDDTDAVLEGDDTDVVQELRLPEDSGRQFGRDVLSVVPRVEVKETLPARPLFDDTVTCLQLAVDRIRHNIPSVSELADEGIVDGEVFAHDLLSPILKKPAVVNQT